MIEKLYLYGDKRWILADETRPRPNRARYRVKIEARGIMVVSGYRPGTIAQSAVRPTHLA